jgi:predicted RNA binding protein YcfA (HicA-like mRNA interferase family)
MVKLPVITPKKLIRVLKDFGFLQDHVTGSHFIFYRPKDKKRVVVPYHIKDLPKGTLMNILKEASISKEEFVRALKKE